MSIMSIDDSAEDSATLGWIEEMMLQFAAQNREKRFEVETPVEVDRSLTAEQWVNKTGLKWFHKNQTVLDSAPTTGLARVMLQIFELDYDPTPTELDHEYKSSGIAPDLAALAKYMCDNPEAVDDRELMCQWGLNPDGSIAFAVFGCEGGVRKVVVGRSSHRWGRKCRFAGVRISPVD